MVRLHRIKFMFIRHFSKFRSLGKYVGNAPPHGAASKQE